MSGKMAQPWRRLIWMGALLGTIIAFSLARNINAIVQWASILSFLATLVGLFLAPAPRSQTSPPGLPALLDQPAEDLALAVAPQWRSEEGLPRLHDPFPLP